jgi:glucosamine--fructose-6-phosphate aminotransferase (isomerizing)
MNLSEEKYSKYAICKEMLETSKVVENFDINKAVELGKLLANKKKIMLTGEGSSRLFPAKRAISKALQSGKLPSIVTEGATQALEYKLDEYAVVAASNSGKTKEAVRLLKKLRSEGHKAIGSVIAHAKTPLEEIADCAFVLSCGNEDAVAATKSVIEQALVMDVALRHVAGEDMPDLKELAAKINEVLSMEVDSSIVDKLKDAKTLYFAGRNNGVAEELTLKTNEITRKKSAYLEGTYAVHGIEEVMESNEAVIIIDPFESEESKFKECLADGVNMNVVAVSTRDTMFPTMKIPQMAGFDEYIQLAAGWNLLVSVGIHLDINLDKPVRARKIGNEFVE